MRPDRDLDWGTRVASLALKKTRDKKSELQAINRVALAAEYVTGDEQWDVLLSVVMHRIELLEGQVAEAVESMRSSDNFDPSVLIEQKLGTRLLGREVESLKWVIELPAILKEQGDRANELLGSIEESPD
jgi:hypothetical protein